MLNWVAVAFWAQSSPGSQFTKLKLVPVSPQSRDEPEQIFSTQPEGGPYTGPCGTGITEGCSDPCLEKTLMDFHWAWAPWPCHFTVATSSTGVR